MQIGANGCGKGGETTAEFSGTEKGPPVSLIVWGDEPQPDLLP